MLRCWIKEKIPNYLHQVANDISINPMGVHLLLQFRIISHRDAETLRKLIAVMISFSFIPCVPGSLRETFSPKKLEGVDLD